MKECTKCKISKPILQFRNPAKTKCIQCEKDKILTKMLKYQNTNIGIENLDTTLKNIIVLSKHLNGHFTVPLELAIEFVQKGRAQVYKPDMIYRTDYERNSWMTRLNVLERDSNKCHYCGEIANTVDHILPVSKGGKYTEDNLISCCHACNIDRGNVSYTKYKKRKRIYY